MFPRDAMVRMLQFYERALNLDETGWRRFANPWAVWTRVTTFLLLVAAIYARHQLGFWWVILSVLIMVYLWYSPRAYPPPPRLDTWTTKAVFGARLFFADEQPASVSSSHHAMGLHLLALSIVGLLPAVYGLIELNPWATVLGVVLVIMPKLWFMDRMVWMYEDMDRELGVEFPFRSLVQEG